MAKNYPTPVVPNPFQVNPPVVIVVRHVRFTAASETVEEDPNDLFRHFRRYDNHRSYPHVFNLTPLQRNIPENIKKKITY